jgi:hypothetical protein
MEARADIISSEETVLQFLLRKARLIADLYEMRAFKAISS